MFLGNKFIAQSFRAYYFCLVSFVFELRNYGYILNATHTRIEYAQYIMWANLMYISKINRESKNHYAIIDTLQTIGTIESIVLLLAQLVIQVR